MRAVLLVAALCAGGPPASAQDGSDDVARGKAAFAEGDYARAEAFWKTGAARGDPEATLGLALLRDGGYGGPRDLGQAFDLYLKAAEMGLDQAQFNVAVMLDAGLGTARDGRAATIWYTRAALRGNLRARYNLGLLLEAGGTGPPAPSRARFWYDAAAELPAASERLRALPPEPTADASAAAPEMLFASRDAGLLELVWSPAGAGGGSFEVEMLGVPGPAGDDAAPLAAFRTPGTGLLRDDPATGRPAVLRVVLADAATRDYRASDWVLGTGPEARVILELAAGHPEMRDLAELIAGDLRAGGAWVRTRAVDGRVPGPLSGPAPAPPEATGVTYGWRPDAARAAEVAALLPALPGDAARLDPSADLRPGEILVRIAGG